MRPGEIFNSEIYRYKDPDTGVSVVQLTNNRGDNCKHYFTSPNFTSDGRKIVFVSNRTGSWQHYLMDLRTGKSVLLTSCKAQKNIYTAIFDPNRRTLYYFDRRILKSVNIDNLKTADILFVPDGFRPSLPSITADGKYIAFSYVEDFQLTSQTNKIYSGSKEKKYQHRRSVIIRLKTDTGEAQAIWGDVKILGALIHPHNPDIIEISPFDYKHGMTKQRWIKQRMAIIDVKAEQVSSLLIQKPNEHCYHEFFTSDGRLMVQMRVDSKKLPRAYNCIIDIHGKHLEKYLLPGKIPGHIHANRDCSLMVGDQCNMVRMEQDCDGMYVMSLMKHKNGRAEVRPLCRHDTSWKTQESHPHPSFSPNGTKILFSSDKEGKCNIYLVDAIWLSDRKVKKLVQAYRKNK